MQNLLGLVCYSGLLSGQLVWTLHSKSNLESLSGIWSKLHLRNLLHTNAPYSKKLYISAAAHTRYTDEQFNSFSSKSHISASQENRPSRAQKNKWFQRLLIINTAGNDGLNQIRSLHTIIYGPENWCFILALLIFIVIVAGGKPGNWDEHDIFLQHLHPQTSFSVSSGSQHNSNEYFSYTHTRTHIQRSLLQYISYIS